MNSIKYILITAIISICIYVVFIIYGGAIEPRAWSPGKQMEFILLTGLANIIHLTSKLLKNEK